MDRSTYRYREIDIVDHLRPKYLIIANHNAVTVKSVREEPRDSHIHGCHRTWLIFFTNSLMGHRTWLNSFTKTLTSSPKQPHHIKYIYSSIYYMYIVQGLLLSNLLLISSDRIRSGSDPIHLSMRRFIYPSIDFDHAPDHWACSRKSFENQILLKLISSKQSNRCHM